MRQAHFSNARAPSFAGFTKPMRQLGISEACHITHERNADFPVRAAAGWETGVIKSEAVPLRVPASACSYRGVSRINRVGFTSRGLLRGFIGLFRGLEANLVLMSPAQSFPLGEPRVFSTPASSVLVRGRDIFRPCPVAAARANPWSTCPRPAQIRGRNRAFPHT